MASPSGGTLFVRKKKSTFSEVVTICGAHFERSVEWMYDTYAMTSVLYLTLVFVKRNVMALLSQGARRGTSRSLYVNRAARVESLSEALWLQ